MKIFNILTTISPPKVYSALLLGTLAGLAYAMLIPLVMNSFTAVDGFKEALQQPVTFLTLEVSKASFAALFLVACILVMAARTFAELILTRIAIDAASDLRRQYYNRILRAPLNKLESVGGPQLIASITTDVRTIIQGAQLLPDLLISAVTVLGMMLFLLYLNTEVFIFFCGALLFGVITFQLPLLLGSKYIGRAREKVDELQHAIHGNIYGIKELKLCQRKRNAYMEKVLCKTEDDVRGAQKTGFTIMRIALNYGDILSFFVIGFLAFIFVNYHTITQQEMFGVIMVLLYITGPIGVVVNAAPQIISSNISLAKVEKLFAELPIEDIDTDIKPLPQWQQFQLRNLTYRYASKDQEPGFEIGPLNLTVNKGSITFIVGGNGSGKTTLGKLITSHYLPLGGHIYLDNLPIDHKYVASYRNAICAITSDFYLFDQLLGEAENADIAVIEDYLEELCLSDKVKIHQGKFSTLALSDGQRKRLALLIAYLEDKDLYLFDEWAADQDPEFKQIFYRRILPELKAKGKAIIVISHDDSYFDVADHVVKMQNGHFRPAAEIQVLPPATKVG
ncbi:MAG: cyclic peptide export ABC transporter [Paraglaciecola sp.]|uniref:cyclic peptide export ABC transporter n=1 Tax=Rheinheimera baltica TaxID=67576 RepID=UPI00273E5AF5|nr:cyclic peptide export ABC transporter [Rheinheimera baltica]MDP5130112.1 cyclic peptide export ABC transporter [Paraglaciecola sp.]MDP5142189.1 cyclic peptide export ABC transporter [Rheinheimera baltica]